MGVSVRLSRNVRVYLPFWIAIPAWLLAAAVWLVILLVMALGWLLFVMPGNIIAASRASRSSQAIGEHRASRPAAEARQPRQHPTVEARWQDRREQAAARPAQPAPSPKPAHTTAAVEAAMQARRDLAVARTAKQADRDAAHWARHRPGWPLWVFLAAVGMFTAAIVFVAVAGPHASQNSPLMLTAGSLGLAAIPVAAVSIVGAVVRAVRRRRALQHYQSPEGPQPL